MAARDEDSRGSLPDDSLGREEFSDFSLILKNGQELKCHKVKLAEVSPFFRTMFRQDCLETQNNHMKVTEFEPETVASFLDYIYADLDLAKDQDLHNMKFDKKRLTPELLRMCHMYQVKNLQEWCARHLLKCIEDANVVDIWRTSEKIGDDQLRRAALDLLGKKGNKLQDVPGLEESLESPQLAKSLVNHMSHQDDVITITI